MAGFMDLFLTINNHDFRNVSRPYIIYIVYMIVRIDHSGNLDLFTSNTYETAATLIIIKIVITLLSITS